MVYSNNKVRLTESVRLSGDCRFMEQVEWEAVEESGSVEQ